MKYNYINKVNYLLNIDTVLTLYTSDPVTANDRKPIGTIICKHSKQLKLSLEGISIIIQKYSTY